MKFSFGPIINERSRTIILGSLPGEASLAMGRYYAHPQNSFWKILYGIYGETPPESFDERYSFILRKELALWDVIKCAQRKGSLDGNIKDEEPNDIPSMLSQYPNISLIIFNGGCAFAKYKKYFGEPPMPYLRMLSTSPACAGRDAEKFAAWEKALKRI